LSAASASEVAVENCVSWSACCPKATTATASPPDFASTNVRAASAALRIARPLIDCELSTASTMLLPAPKLTAWRPLTAMPFSSTFGARATRSGVTTLTTTRG
jgi:hypothetical protein